MTTESSRALAVLMCVGKRVLCVKTGRRGSVLSLGPTSLTVFVRFDGIEAPELTPVDRLRSSAL